MYKKALELFNIETPPEIWERHWADAEATFQEVSFITDEYIGEANQILNLSDQQVEMLHETALFFRSSQEGRFFMWLWYFIVFNSGEKDLQLSTWVVPESLPEHLSGMPHALVLLGAIPALKSFYAKKGIPEDIMAATLKDVSIIMDEHRVVFGYYGVGNFRLDWLVNHFTGKLFWIGRLQFIFDCFKGNVVIAKKGSEYKVFEPDAFPADGFSTVLTPGDGLLDVHIPRHGPMTYELCAESYNQAKDFYRRFSPEYTIKGFTCNSWLLSPELKKILPPESNILRFSNDYFVYETSADDHSLYEYVFEVKKGDELPENTSLQKRLKELLASGGYIGTGCGVILE